MLALAESVASGGSLAGQIALTIAAHRQGSLDTASSLVNKLDTAFMCEPLVPRGSIRALAHSLSPRPLRSTPALLRSIPSPRASKLARQLSPRMGGSRAHRTPFSCLWARVRVECGPVA
jgi:hypothetical protein